VSSDPVERLRELWTPERETAEIEVDDAPQTPLDSMIRDLLHRVIQQKGPMTLTMEQDGAPILNIGALRWEIAGVPGYREVSLWIEEA